MRKLILLGLFLGSLPAAAVADPAPAPAASGVYRWVDNNGTVHYSDAPPSSDARPTALPQIQTFKPEAVRHGADVGSGPPSPAAAPPPARPVITSPPDQDTIRDEGGVIEVSVMPSPDYRLLTYYLDGAAQNAAPTDSTSLKFQGVVRGSHTIVVASVDGSGRELSRSNPVTIYYMPPRVNQVKH